MNHYDRCIGKEIARTFIVLLQFHCSGSNTVTDKIQRVISPKLPIQSSGEKMENVFSSS